MLTFYLLTIAINSMGQIPENALALWLQANEGTRQIGNNLISWSDQSGKKHDATTTTTDFPKLIPNAINGYPAVRFNGNNNGMETPAFLSFPDKRGAIFIVVKLNGRSSTSGVGVGNLVATFHGKGMVWQFCAAPSKYSFYDGTGSEGIPISETQLTDWNVVGLVRSTDTSINIYNGGRFEKKIPINDNQPGINTIKIGYNGRLGGTATDSIPEVLNGDIAEIIMYDRALDEFEMQLVHQYLSKKYALALRPPPIWERWWFYVLIIFLCLSVMVTAILLIKQRKLKQQLAIFEKEQQMDKERQRISREMHDYIGAGLTQITLMSESIKINANPNHTRELNDIAETGRDLVTSMSEIIWSLNPENKTLEQLITYLREQLIKQFEYTEIDCHLNFTDKGKDRVVSNDQRRNILLATREIANNAIKYSGAKNFWAIISLESNLLHVEISDDGCGFDGTLNFSGNGLKNIRHRIKEMGGYLELQSQKGNGTRFTFTVPL